MSSLLGAWYRTGKVNVTQGSNVVVGEGTQWKNALLAIVAGDIFTLNSTKWYEVIAVDNNTQLYLNGDFEGDSELEANYAIIRSTSGTVLTGVAGQVALLFNQKQLLLDEINRWLISVNDTENITDSHGTEIALTTPKKMEAEHQQKISELEDFIQQALTISSLHLWIAYADDALGNGISLVSVGKKFIGFAKDRESSEVSIANPNVFDWSLFKGADGLSVEGTSSYLHLAFADDANGTGFTQNSTGKRFIGIYADSTVEDSDSYHDYNWLEIPKGEKGDTGIGTIEELLLITNWGDLPRSGADVTDYSDFRVSNGIVLQAADIAAQAKVDLVRTQIEAYADGIVTAEETRAIDDAQAKADLAELVATAYADNLVTVEEQRAITDATEKANLAEVTAKAYADGIVTAEESRAITDATAKANLAEVTAKAYADGIVTAEESRAIADAQAKADAAALSVKVYMDETLTGFVTGITYASDQAVIQAQLDKSITTWFYDVAPTLLNTPASEWDTDEDKNVHLGDLYYDNITGFGYRFRLISSVYSWLLITDSGITTALANASKAQDTADSKRRVFVAQPVTPYDVGDLWDTGLGVKRSNVTRSVNSFYNASDWLLISDKTDYEAVQNLADAAQDAAIAGGQARADLARIQAEAYADYIVSEEEARAIADASAKADVAQLTAITIAATAAQAKADFAKFEAITAADIAAQAKDELAKIQAEAYTDAFVSAEETRAIADASEKADAAEAAALAAAKIYASTKANAAEANAIATATATAAIASQAKADLAKIQAKAYADGIVSDEEARAIADATAKANTAQAAALAAAKTYATSKANAAQANAIATADTAAQTKANLAKVEAKAYADGIVTDEEARAIADATAKANTAQSAAEAAARTYTNTTVNVAKASAIATAASAAQTKANLAKVQAQAYADGIVSDEEERAIADATAKANAAQAAALAAAKTYATTKANAAQANAIAAANTSAQAKANLARVQASAYADGIVTLVESFAIADATAKANAAKSHADAKAAAAQAAAIEAAKEWTDAKSSDHVLFDMNGSAPDIMPFGAPSPLGYRRTSGTTIYSDYIPVRKGETLYTEIWSQQGGYTSRAYIGLSRYDRNKRPITSNTGRQYSGMSNTLMPIYWTKYSGTHVMPTSHTPYGGSDGKEVCFVKVVILMNYQTGGTAYYSGYRLFRKPDQQYLPNLVSAGAGTALNKNPLTASDNGSTAKITIASHTRQYGFGLLSLNSGSITGLSFSRTYYVYYDDPLTKGGSVTYRATTNILTSASNNDRVYVSSIRTPSNGGGGTIPDPGDECVCLDMWLTHTLQAADVIQGDELTLWWSGNQSILGKVLQAQQVKQKQLVYELETSSGAIVRVSESTPLTLENQVVITPKELIVGLDSLATLKGEDNLLVWEVVSRCEMIGKHAVMHISVGNGSFAAGLDPNNRIITHNAQVKP